MSFSSYVIIGAVCCAFAALVIFLLLKGTNHKHRAEGCADECAGTCADGVPDEGMSEDDHIFNGFITQHEKRILAYLIEEAAKRCALDRDAIIALRGRYGTELTRPAYDAQDQVGRCGIGPMAVTRLQKGWIERNGGNPAAHPSSREVERILIERNKNKADSICRGSCV